ncbi:hypothetical protein ACYOEI_18100 [Singulisphaera rosea]
MKSIAWALMACRILAVSLGLTLLNSGCGPQSVSYGGVTTEEAKWNDDSRKAMEANAKLTYKTAHKARRGVKKH